MWLRRSPQYTDSAKWITEILETHKNLAVDKDTKKTAKFAESQFRRIEDFTALIWLRDFLVRTVGGITHMHVDIWRQRRMYAAQTPAQAYAQLFKEGLIIHGQGQA